MKCNLTIRIIVLAASLILIHETAFAADAPDAQPSPAPAAAKPGAPQAEEVNVENIKEKYWARGDESEMGVVQNRLYSKEHKFEVEAFGGLIFSDPFLSVHSAGLGVGYHFSEYFSLHAIYFKDWSSPSSAASTLAQATTVNSDPNPPNYFAGIEGRASLLYGKLSVIGKSIIYYDFHFILGAGDTNVAAWSGGTNGSMSGNANELTGYVGVGQQVYLNKFMSLNLDYRLMAYGETIYEQNVAASYGNAIGSRTNWTNALTLGVGFLIGGPSK